MRFIYYEKSSYLGTIQFGTLLKINKKHVVALLLSTFFFTSTSFSQCFEGKYQREVDGRQAGIEIDGSGSYSYFNRCMFYGDDMGRVYYEGTWTSSGNKISLSRGAFSKSKSDSDVHRFCGGMSLAATSLTLKGNDLHKDGGVYKRLSPPCSKASSASKRNGTTSNQAKDKFSIYEDPIISNGAHDFIKTLAANSDNPGIKALSDGLKKVDDFKNEMHKNNQTLAMFGYKPTQEDVELQKMFENVGQAKAIYDGIKVLFTEQKVELTPSQKAARSYMWEMRRRVKLIYDEAKLIPHYDTYDKQTLAELEKLERSYLAYDLSTATERYMLSYYFWGHHLMTMPEVQQVYNSTAKLAPIDNLKRIDVWQNKSNVGYSLYLANSDVGFQVNGNLIKMKKAMCYKNMGQETKANDLIKSINFGVSDLEAISLMREAFIQKDYEVASYFYPVVKRIFEHERAPKTSYIFDIDKSNNDKRIQSNGLHKYVFGLSSYAQLSKSQDLILRRTDVIALLSIGSYVAIKNENISQANNEITFLENYVKRVPENATVSDQLVSESIVLGMKAALLVLQGNNQKAMELSELAVNKGNGALQNDFSSWLSQLHFELLVSAKEYERANEIYINLNLMKGQPNRNATFYDPYELKLSKCEMLYEMKEYKRVLNGLNILEANKPDLRYNILRAKVYEAQGEKDKAITELNKIK